ncbi:putative membrane protein [Clostridium bornimense]|uniref:Putative membrane protein n=1 Tax=Clostridium bornimense TaxID=1216932 RepID=W6RUZ6_9CLOT|nr:hypothetical protein [Clostridium bornimense]CDM68491.1 putative membrane protein [Clostridium bornimense]
MKCLNLNFKRKKGSAMMMVLVLSSAIIIVAASMLNTLTKTMQLNDQYNKNDDMKLAAESANNIAKAQLIKNINDVNGDVIYLSELRQSYDFTDKVKGLVGDDGLSYSVEATLDTESSQYKIKTIVTDSKGNSVEDVETVKINMNIGPGISPIIDEKKALSLLLEDGTLSVKATELGAIPSQLSEVPTDIWYVQAKTIDLNSETNVYIPKNTIVGSNVNGYSDGDLISNSGVRKTYAMSYQISLEENGFPFKDNEEVEELLDITGQSVVGYTKKFNNGVKVVVVNGNINVVGHEANLEDTIIYAAGKLRIGTVYIKMNNSMLVAGQDLELVPYSLTIKNNPSYDNPDAIKEFLVRYTR